MIKELLVVKAVKVYQEHRSYLVIQETKVCCADFDHWTALF